MRTGYKKKLFRRKKVSLTQKKFSKVSSSFVSFDPLDVEGAAFHTFDAKTLGGVTE